ncbi:MAG: hypothetical protein K0M66_15095 [Thiobacillus sp.]|nr:hypothetical protein [Thiobacillus sp.]
MTTEPVPSAKNYQIDRASQSAIGDNARVNINTYSAPRQLVERPYCVTHCPLGRDDAIVGRADLLDTLRTSLIDGHRPVLKYLAGVGKTTLALQLAYDEDFFSQFEGVLWADIGAKPHWAALLRRWYRGLVNDPAAESALDSEQDWFDAVRDAIGARRMLIILDDVWQHGDAARLMALGPRCAFLITTRFPQLANALADAPEQRYEVKKLDDDESWSLISSLAPRAVECFPDDTRRIADSADGLPLALHLLGKQLMAASDDDDRLREAVATLLEPAGMMDLPVPSADSDDVGNEDATLSTIIGKSLKVLGSEAKRQAFLNLCIFQADPHSFDKDTARACGVSSTLLYELHDAGFIECRSRGRYTMHRILAEFGRRRLDADTSRALHRDAALHFAGLLSTASDDTSDYLAWYRYEQGDWRDLVDTWLYHLAHAGDGERAFMSLLRVFFDAFWWWGYYLRYDYCDTLIKIWRARNIAPEIRDRLALLERFLDAYPAGYEKRGTGDWGAVTRTLRTLRALCDASPESGSDDARQVRGFIDFFLAEALAYGGGEPQAAMQAYRDAIDYFSASDQQWVSCWIAFYLAQFLWENGDRAAARVSVQRSLALEHEDEPVWERDPEVLANDYRLLTEIDLAAGDLVSAARAARRAAFYAWLFQGIPESADDYTRVFYVEITHRLAHLLVAHAGSHAADALWIARDLFTFMLLPARDDAAERTASVEQALSDGDAVALVAALFPKFPDTPDSANECQRRVCLYKNILLDALDEAPH